MLFDSQTGSIINPDECRRIFCNRVSATYIPRPVSGTSRRASTTLLVPAKDTSSAFTPKEPLLSPSHARRSSQFQSRMDSSNDGMPPSSFPTLRAILPRSNSSVPFKDRPQPDISGVHEQLPLRNFSRHLLQSPDDFTTPSPRNVLRSSRSSCRSNETLPSKDIKPKSLMKPIHPPLPRNQTAGQIACFGSTSNASPPKAVRKIDLAQGLKHQNDSAIDVVDALLESRMTKHEIQSLDQVRLETAVNLQRLSLTRAPISYRSSTASVSSSPAFVRHKDSLVASEASGPCATNRHMSEERTSRSFSQKPLAVNVELANKPSTRSPPSPHSAQFSACRSSSYSPSELSLDLRKVYHPEDTAYWTGRFITTSDRLRKFDCDRMLLPKDGHDGIPDTASAAFEKQYDELEDTRMTRALQELEQYCKSPSALRSFDRFRTQLMADRSKRRTSLLETPASTSQPDVIENHIGMTMKTMKPRVVTGLRQFSNNSATSQLATFSAQGTIEKLSGLVSRGGGLVKSKTTGNLAAMPLHKRPQTPGVLKVWDSSKDHSAIPTSAPERNQRSFSKTLSKTRARAIKERESRSKPTPSLGQSTDTLRPTRTSSKTFNEPMSTGSLSQSQSMSILPVRSAVSSSGFITKNTQITPSVTATALENGHGPPPASPPPPPVDKKQRFRTSTRPRVIDGDKVTYNRKRGDRQKSGQSGSELMKKMVGASLREVRKMSRRVGSMGWNGSLDDMTVSKTTE